MYFHCFWSSCVLRSPRSSSTSTILRTSRPWMSQDLPAKRLPSRFWMCFTTRCVPTWNCGAVKPFFSGQPSNHLFFYPIVQLDCCGKGDDTALFKQVAGTLCPRKSPEDFLKSQVSSKHSLRDLGFTIQGASGLLASSALCAGPVFIYFLLSPPRAVTINSSSCSPRSSTWLAWLLWWSPSSWWVSHPPDEDRGSSRRPEQSLTCRYLFRSLRWSSPWCCAVGSGTALECTRTRSQWSRPKPQRQPDSSRAFFFI